ncbi:MAG: hypothetical protein IPL88_08435 [Rhizobiales bacterium]|nr:hypothetical protein [Hyphomicrobiales bacterium]
MPYGYDDALIEYLIDVEGGRWARFVEFLGLRSTNWLRTAKEVDRRRIAYNNHVANIGETDHARYHIAAVDIFVEKAQHFLQNRSKQYGISALVSSLFLIGVLGFDFYYLTNVATIPQFLTSLGETGDYFAIVADRIGVLLGRAPAHPAAKIDLYIFLMWMLRGLAMSALSGAAIYLLASLTRAFLHEATLYWNRWHAVRLGRLFIYFKFAGLGPDELSRVRETLTIDEVERAFGWNLETSTAFRDIKPEMMTGKSPLEDIVKIVSAIEGVRKSREGGEKAKD